MASPTPQKLYNEIDHLGRLGMDPDGSLSDQQCRELAMAILRDQSIGPLHLEKIAPSPQPPPAPRQRQQHHQCQLQGQGTSQHHEHHHHDQHQTEQQAQESLMRSECCSDGNQSSAKGRNCANCDGMHGGHVRMPMMAAIVKVVAEAEAIAEADAEEEAVLEAVLDEIMSLGD